MFYVQNHLKNVVVYEEQRDSTDGKVSLLHKADEGLIAWPHKELSLIIAGCVPKNLKKKAENKEKKK